MKELITYLLITCVLLLLCSCAAPPNKVDKDEIVIAKPNQVLEPTDSMPSTSPSTNNSETVDEYNYLCVSKEDGIHIVQASRINDAYLLSIDADVCVSSVERVNLYKYVPASITDAQRDALFYSLFGDNKDNVIHGGINWESWVLETEDEHYRFGYSRGTKYIIEETFSLRDMKTRLERFDFRMLKSISESGMTITLNQAFSMCEPLLYSLTDQEYVPTNVRPFTVNSESNEGMLWITWRKKVDGMPIFADNDPKFCLTDNRILTMYGSVYELTPLTIEQRIIDLDSAVGCLMNYASRLNLEKGQLYLDHLFEEEIPISKITFEYIVLQGTDMSYVVTPVWRFHIGSNDEENLILEDRILAINALTGDLIAERRGHTF